MHLLMTCLYTFLLLCFRVTRHILRLTTFSRLGTESSPQYQLQDTDEVKEWDRKVARSLENVLGKFYKPKTRHRFLPPLPKLKFNHNQMIVYSSLPFKDLQPIEEPKTPGILLNSTTGYKSSSTLLPRIQKAGGFRTTSDVKHATFYNPSAKHNRGNISVTQKNTPRKPYDGTMRSSFKK